MENSAYESKEEETNEYRKNRYDSESDKSSSDGAFDDLEEVLRDPNKIK